MVPLLSMSSCPPDLEGARCFVEAIRGYQRKQIAICCDVRESLVTKWSQIGNVPESRIDRLPPDAQRRYAELQAIRRGARVLERDMLDALFRWIGWCPVPATLGPAECGPLTRRQERASAA